jgi:hypothetical protein
MKKENDMTDTSASLPNGKESLGRVLEVVAMSKDDELVFWKAFKTIEGELEAAQLTVKPMIVPREKGIGVPSSHMVVLCLPDEWPESPGIGSNIGRVVGWLEAKEAEIIVVGGETEWLGETRPMKLQHIPRLLNEPESIARLSDAIRLAVYRDQQMSKRPQTVDFFEKRSEAPILKAFREAQKDINILATNLKWFAGGKDEDPEILKSLKEAGALRSVQIKILALDPESSFVSGRAAQLGKKPAALSKEMAESLETLKKELVEAPGSSCAQLREYDDFPTQMTIAVDDDVYVGVVCRASRIREGCMFRVKKNRPGVERSFIFHFNALWVMSRPYSG